MMRTAGEEREKRETERQREKIRGKMNQTQTTIFYIQFSFWDCNFVDETPCCLIPPFITSNVSIRVIVKLHDEIGLRLVPYN